MSKDQNHQTLPIDPNVDPYGYVGMVRRSDGSITRLQEPSVPIDTSKNHSLVVTKDIAINSSKNTWARIILPRRLLHPPTTTAKLPLVIYFHGGGFIVGTVDTPIFQGLYASLASEIPAVVVSIEYRQAPEHRLPAAYEDCMEALHWIKNKPDEWLVNYADFSKCFLMGTSAGGNIVYHLGLKAASIWDNLKPLDIKGLILNQPFFGGTERTQSELKLVNDKVLPPIVSDVMWELGLPEGVDRDHEYSNPMVGIKSNTNLFDQVKLLGWKILVTGCDGDPLIDRQINLVRVLKELGVQIVGSFTHGAYHGSVVSDPLKAKEFSIVVKEFVTA
ncbi:carboxylesterase 1 [Lycium ferocissimum]|uniref:carboxylesterase 1 n=1 Tax=Lycium ferocissimum TaxID=112874 RepID=UPI0028155FA1|nr:carboxylesterase 1 [Lycium ferocissimum]